MSELYRLFIRPSDRQLTVIQLSGNSGQLEDTSCAAKNESFWRIGKAEGKRGKDTRNPQVPRGFKGEGILGSKFGKNLKKNTRTPETAS